MKGHNDIVILTKVRTIFSSLGMYLQNLTFIWNIENLKGHNYIGIPVHRTTVKNKFPTSIYIIFSLLYTYKVKGHSLWIAISGLLYLSPHAPLPAFLLCTPPQNQWLLFKQILLHIMDQCYFCLAQGSKVIW